MDIYPLEPSLSPDQEHHFWRVKGDYTDDLDVRLGTSWGSPNTGKTDGLDNDPDAWKPAWKTP